MGYMRSRVDIFYVNSTWKYWDLFSFCVNFEICVDKVEFFEGIFRTSRYLVEEGVTLF